MNQNFKDKLEPDIPSWSHNFHDDAAEGPKMNEIEQYLNAHEIWRQSQPQGPSVTVRGKVGDAKKASEVKFLIGVNGGIFMDFDHPRWNERDSCWIRTIDDTKKWILDVLTGKKEVQATASLVVTFDDENSEMIQEWFKQITAKD